MDCASLARYGITKWDELGAAFAPDAPGVYVFRYPRMINRFNGESDILYIGCAAALRTRVAAHNQPSTASTPDVTMSAYQRRLWELRTSGLVQIGWCILGSRQQARQREREMLDEYLYYHDELPPLNSRVG